MAWPLLESKPFSSVKMADRPPPRSSEPRRPQREPLRLPVLMPVLLWPPGPLLTYCRPVSIRPYRVTVGKLPGRGGERQSGQAGASRRDAESRFHEGVLFGIQSEPTL